MTTQELLTYAHAADKTWLRAMRRGAATGMDRETWISRIQETEATGQVRLAAWETYYRRARQPQETPPEA